jgi:hypothetical protein
MSSVTMAEQPLMSRIRNGKEDSHEKISSCSEEGEASEKEDDEEEKEEEEEEDRGWLEHK